MCEGDATQSTSTLTRHLSRADDLQTFKMEDTRGLGGHAGAQQTVTTPSCADHTPFSFIVEMFSKKMTGWQYERG